MDLGGPLVLIVDDDIGMRRLLRTGLELEGFRVIEAATLAQARSVRAERVHGVVLDRELPDGDGFEAWDELHERHPGALILLHTSGVVPPGCASVPKGDVNTLIEALGPPEDALLVHAASAPDVARAAADAIVEEWVELCRWDPELPADNRPPIAGSVVAAVTQALERPQPLGWGLDPALESVAQAYVLNTSELDVAVSQLVCLREAFERKVVDELPADQLEAARRLTMIVQRLMTVVVRAGVHELRAAAFTDPFTGLGNTRAFEVDLRREMYRAHRRDLPITVVRLHVGDGALVNERELRAVGLALADEPHAYRLGWVDFALLLPDIVAVDPDAVLAPIREVGVDHVAVGLASHPPDPIDDLAELAEQRLGVAPASRR